ncbi:hypothetical protein BLNAU_1935 [Blattamonas nauphoetae]|uniref:Uncharacterized protein n=1 Tax=Blattamonas nauphoetae TaxID=2049346 RepID=A0ABQ9YGM3_9EUKA|nr:hypothetical protein BLNAU_1935 [Blattamonas nauphoetae]
MCRSLPASHIPSPHIHRQLKHRGEISVGERVDGSTGGVWSLNHSDRFLFTAAERGSHAIRSPFPRIRLYEELSRQSPSSDSEAVGSDTLLLFIMADRAREGAEAAQFPIRTRSQKEMSKTRNRHKQRELVQAIKAKGPRKQSERRIHKWWHKTRSLEDEEFEREQKELLEQEKSEKKKRQNSDDLVLSEEGLSGADDDSDKVLAGLQDTAFTTIAQLFQPSEDDDLKEYLGAMESIADAIFASNLEVEGEEEMTVVAFSFGSEDELSDSDTSDMERLLAMLSPVDSSDSVMLLHQNNRSLECKRNKTQQASNLTDLPSLVSVSPDDMKFSSMEQTEKHKCEEESVKAPMENKYIVKSNTPLLMQSHHISRPTCSVLIVNRLVICCQSMWTSNSDS